MVIIENIWEALHLCRAELPGVDIRTAAQVTRRGVARHEAGHAVAALALDYPVAFLVALDRDGFFASAGSPSPDDTAAIYAAGPVAQRITWIGLTDAHAIVAAAKGARRAPLRLYERGQRRARRLLGRHAAAWKSLSGALFNAGQLEQGAIAAILRDVDPPLARAASRPLGLLGAFWRACSAATRLRRAGPLPWTPHAEAL